MGIWGKFRRGGWQTGEDRRRKKRKGREEAKGKCRIMTERKRRG